MSRINRYDYVGMQMGVFDLRVGVSPALKVVLPPAVFLGEEMPELVEI